MASGESAATRILVVAPSWIGDLVMAQPLFAHLAQRPGVEQIDAVAPPATFPLLDRIPEVTRSLLLPAGHGELALGARRELARELRGAAYDRGIVLPNTLKSALVPWLARIPRRTGWRGEMRYGLVNDLRVLDEAALPLLVDRYLALGAPAGEAITGSRPSPELRVDPTARAETLRKLELSGDGPILALCPGAEYGPAKRWPAPHFAEVAADFLRGGWQVWTFGSARDSEITRAVRDSIPTSLAEGFSDLAGCTTLPEAVDLLSLARAVISNDSGLSHVACAVGCAVWVVFGSSSPGFTPPLSERATVLTMGLECSPCFERECPLGHLDCLRKLGPERVLEEMRRVLGADRTDPASGEER